MAWFMGGMRFAISRVLPLHCHNYSPPFQLTANQTGNAQVAAITTNYTASSAATTTIISFWKAANWQVLQLKKHSQQQISAIRRRLPVRIEILKWFEGNRNYFLLALPFSFSFWLL